MPGTGVVVTPKGKPRDPGDGINEEINKPW